MTERRSYINNDGWGSAEDEWELPSGRARRREQKRARKKRRGPVRRALSFLFKFLGVLLLTVLIGGGVWGYFQLRSIVAKAPTLDTVTLAPSQAATYIYSRDGKREQKLTLPEANRDLVTLDQIPKSLQQAVIAIEDARFYEHHGIDPKGIVRALLRGLKSRSFSEGASTITQQLLKNTVFPGWTSERTFRERLERKIQEQYLALQLEKMMSKEEILEDYLNLINLGAGCYGVQAASYRYFGKDVSDLTLSEGAVIAGITQNPTAYNPLVYPGKNEARRKQVLGAMLEQGYIDKNQYDEALADDVYDRIQNNESAVDTGSSVYTFYQDALIAQVMEDLQDELAYTYQQAFRAVYAGGLRIYSAQDPEVQAVCDAEFENSANFPSGTQVGIDYALSVQDADSQVTDYGNDDLRTWVRQQGDTAFDLMFDTSEQARARAEAFRNAVVREGDTVLGERITITPQPQASCVVLDQSTGYVAALVGGRGEKEASLTLNRASYTLRQPGSTFKILTAYAPALNEGKLTLASVMTDEPYSYADGTPVNNADKTFRGDITVREAIVQSVNVVAVKVLSLVTPQTGYDYAKRLGIRSLTDHLETASGILTDVTQTLALGGISRGVTNLELTGAYAAIANLGHAVEPKFYTQVMDQYGNVLLDNSAPGSRTVLKESTAVCLTSAMRDVVASEDGTAYGLIDLGQMPVAGKTGTTSDWRDSWFVGYTPYYTCGIWAGYDNNAVLPDADTYHTYSKTLWNAIMRRLHAGKQISAFSGSADTVRMRLCPKTHMAAAPNCPDAYEEVFAKGTQPKYYCSVHGDGSPVDGGTAGGAQQNAVTPQNAITIYNTDQTTTQVPAAPDPSVTSDPTGGWDLSGQAGDWNAAGNPGADGIPEANDVTVYPEAIPDEEPWDEEGSATWGDNTMWGGDAAGTGEIVIIN